MCKAAIALTANCQDLKLKKEYSGYPEYPEYPVLPVALAVAFLPLALQLALQLVHTGVPLVPGVYHPVALQLAHALIWGVPNKAQLILGVQPQPCRAQRHAVATKMRVMMTTTKRSWPTRRIATHQFRPDKVHSHKEWTQPTSQLGPSQNFIWLELHLYRRRQWPPRRKPILMEMHMTQNRVSPAHPQAMNQRGQISMTL